jgi:hypothetical protein
MNAATFAAITGDCAGLLTFITVLITGIRFFYRKGKADQELINTLKAITEANTSLSEAFKRYTEKTDKTLRNYDNRITRLEPYEQNGHGRHYR